MAITKTQPSTHNQDFLKKQGYNVPQSVAARDTENDYECLISSEKYTWCKKVESTSPPPTEPDSPEIPQDNDTGIDSFAEDVNLKSLDEPTRKKMDKVWGVTSDSFYKEIDGVRFYKTKEDKVYLGSYKADDLALIKDRKEGNEGMNQSQFTMEKLKSMSEGDMLGMLNRVKSIKENKSEMKKILKEEYQKRKLDKEIISTRFKIISESVSVESIISEVSYLNKQNYSESLIKEGLFELINALYQDDENAIPKLKDSYKNWLMRKLPNEGDLFNKSIEKGIDKLKNDEVPTLFSDCDKVVDLIYTSLIEGMVDDNFDVVGVPNEIENVIKQEIIDNLKKDDMKTKIKKQLTNKICPQYGELMRNTEKTFEDLKGKLLS